MKWEFIFPRHVVDQGLAYPGVKVHLPGQVVEEASEEVVVVLRGVVVIAGPFRVIAGPFPNGFVEVSLKVPDEPISRPFFSFFFGFRPMSFSCRPERFEVLGEAVVEHVPRSVCHRGVIFHELRERRGAFCRLTISIFKIVHYLQVGGFVAALGEID